MEDDITARRLKKKVLDRWENEGGKIVANTVTADGSDPEKDREGKIKELPGPHGITTTGDPNTPSKARKTK